MALQDFPLNPSSAPYFSQALDASYATVLEDILAHYEDRDIPAYTEHMHNCSALSRLVQRDFRCCLRKSERQTDVRRMHCQCDRDDVLEPRTQSEPSGRTDSMRSTDMWTIVRECLRRDLRSLDFANYFDDLDLVDDAQWQQHFSISADTHSLVSTLRSQASSNAARESRSTEASSLHSTTGDGLALLQPLRKGSRLGLRYLSMSRLFLQLKLHAHMRKCSIDTTATSPFDE